MNKEDIIIEMIRDLSTSQRDIVTNQKSLEERLDRRISEVNKNMRYERERLDEIYDERKMVTVKFSTVLVGFNLLLSAIIAFFVSLWR